MAAYASLRPTAYHREAECGSGPGISDHRHITGTNPHTMISAESYLSRLHGQAAGPSQAAFDILCKLEVWKGFVDMQNLQR